MLNIIVVVTTFLIPSVVVAQTQSEVLTCAGDGMLAEIFMGHRQLGGYDLTKMMTKFGAEPGLREMILQAYDYPIMLTAQTRKFTIAEFKNKWILRCYREGPALPRKETSGG